MSKPKRVLVRSVGATIRDSHGERAIVVWACGQHAIMVLDREEACELAGKLVDLVKRWDTDDQT